MTTNATRSSGTETDCRTLRRWLAAMTKKTGIAGEVDQDDAVEHHPEQADAVGRPSQHTQKSARQTAQPRDKRR